jgi:gamma-glutamylputrescine oxidase
MIAEMQPSVGTATTPFWQDEPYAPGAPLAGDATAEVCVIGAGIGGLACARNLLDRGVRPLVLEARTVASGATGRNGGFFIAGVAPMYHRAVEAWGRETAARRYRATLEAQREMLRVAEEAGAREHFRVHGLLRLAADDAEVEDVLAHHAALAADGLPGELVAAEDLPPAVRRPGRVALLTTHDGGVHPVRWARALAATLRARGATIAEHTRVLSPPEPDGDGVLVRTDRGDVRAARVLVALDGGLATLVPRAAIVRTRRLNMIATAPAPAGVLPMPVYVRDGHEYAQQLPDGRITLGGFSDLDGAESWTDREDVAPAVQARLDAWLAEELGLDVPVTHRWAGLVGYAEDPVPCCGAVPGSDGRVVALGGYNGTGHIQAWVAARIATGVVLDGRAPDDDLYASIAGVEEWLREHVRAFNAAVRGGDFDGFASRWAPGGRLAFEGVPVGPFEGRDAVAAAYREQPPDDELVVLATEERPDGTVVASYAWAAEPAVRAGEMRFRRGPEGIEELVVTFDAS